MAPDGTLFAYGDSITWGYLVDRDQAWPDIFAAALGLEPNNGAACQHQVIDQAFAIYQHETLPGGIAGLMIGVNDNARGRADPDLAFYRGCLKACAAFLAIPRSDLIPATQIGGPGFTFNPPRAWKPGAYPPFGMAASQSGDWFEITLTGTVAYLCFVQAIDEAHVAPAAFGACTITVNGSSPIEFDTESGVQGGSKTGVYIGPSLVRIELVGNGPFTIRCEVTRPGMVCVSWAWSDGLGLSNYPELYLGLPTRLAAERYPDFGTLGGTQNYAGSAMSVAGELFNDGLKVYAVDTYAALDPLTDLKDGVHPTPQGHAKLAVAFLEAYNAAHAPPSPPHVDGALGACSLCSDSRSGVVPAGS